MSCLVFFRKTSVFGALFALSVFVGCGPSVAVNNQGQSGGGGNSSGGGGGSGGIGGGSNFPSCFSGNAGVFAMNKIFLGDTNADGTPDSLNAWKSFGLNIDGRISTPESTDLCKPAAGGSNDVFLDGNEGIDNSFGRNVLPNLLSLDASLSEVNNQALQNGEQTYLLKLADVGPAPCSTSISWLLGANLGQTPQFNGSDVWPIQASSLVDASNPDSAKCMYSNTSIDMGIVHAGPPSQFDLVLKLSGIDMVLPVQRARMLFTLDPDTKSIAAGQIGGVIRTEDFVKEIKRVAAIFDPSFCDPQNPTISSIVNTVRKQSDIMQDGTQDPNEICDGISIGLGFTMKPAQLGPVAPLAPPPPEPCAP